MLAKMILNHSYIHMFLYSIIFYQCMTGITSVCVYKTVINIIIHMSTIYLCLASQFYVPHRRTCRVLKILAMRVRIFIYHPFTLTYPIVFIIQPLHYIVQHSISVQ